MEVTNGFIPKNKAQISNFTIKLEELRSPGKTFKKFNYVINYILENKEFQVTKNSHPTVGKYSQKRPISEPPRVPSPILECRQIL